MNGIVLELSCSACGKKLQSSMYEDDDPDKIVNIVDNFRDYLDYHLERCLNKPGESMEKVPDLTTHIRMDGGRFVNLEQLNAEIKSLETKLSELLEKKSELAIDNQMIANMIRDAKVEGYVFHHLQDQKGLFVTEITLEKGGKRYRVFRPDRRTEPIPEGILEIIVIE